MIKVDVVEEKDGLHLYVEASKEEDRDNLDKIFAAVMSKEKKLGGYKSSLAFDVLVLNKP